MATPKPFIATTVPLQNSNLIEASAGTGKTYSIAILVLRLLLEKKFSIKEILMVTFTKAAVAELEERIRLFVREAYRASKGEKINDPLVASIVDGFPDNKEAQQLLKEAVLFLDETSVLTIHSFCQKTLNEFAFETNQLFGAETIKDTATIIEEQVNKFWRKNITTLSPELLQPLIFDGKLSRKSLSDAIKEFLGGKKYFSFDEKEDFSLNDNCRAAFIKELKELKEKEDALNQEVIEYVMNNAKRLREISSKNQYAKTFPTGLFNNPQEFIQTILSKRKSGYIGKLFQDVLDQCDDCDEAKNAKDKTLNKIISHITCFAIQETLSGIRHYKQLNNQISFDDMISHVHTALIKENSGKLIDELQKKYKAVFVDEFQDTDRMQYEIFQKAFGENTILFYIGDPKQSIYAFRKADIFTYFKAYKEVENIYQMNENFRSSERMIEAMNLFFQPDEEFDAFFFKNSEDAINYIEVSSPSPNKK
jgi:exodeoxyribonuclease V beta subunit